MKKLLAVLFSIVAMLVLFPSCEEDLSHETAILEEHFFPYTGLLNIITSDDNIELWYESSGQDWLDDDFVEDDYTCNVQRDSAGTLAGLDFIWHSSQWQCDIAYRISNVRLRELDDMGYITKMDADFSITVTKNEVLQCCFEYNLKTALQDGSGFMPVMYSYIFSFTKAQIPGVRCKLDKLSKAAAQIANQAF